MLSAFRRGGAGQVVVGAIVFAIIVVFVLEFRTGRGPGAGLSRECAVETEGRCIDRKEYFAAHGLIVPRGIQPKRAREMGLRRQVLDGLIERELLISEANRLGISISEQAIDDELASGRAHVSLPAAQAAFLSYNLGLTLDGVRLLPVKSVQSGTFDYKIYERVVKNTTNRSPREFKEMQRRELIAKRMRELVRGRVRVSLEEAFAQWERERTSAVVRVAKLEKDWFQRFAVDSSDAAVDAWAKENVQQVDEAWKAETKRTVAGCILASEVFVAAGPDVSNEAKVDIRQRIDAAHARLKAKEPFALVVRQVSEAVTASYGGEIGCLAESYGAGADELVAIAKTMKPGEISPVLETPRGFHILQTHGTLAERDLERVGKRLVARRLSVPLRADVTMAGFANELVERAKKGEALDEVVKELATAHAQRIAAAVPALRPAKDAELPALDAANKPRVEISSSFNRIVGPSIEVSGGDSPTAKLFEMKVDQVLEKPVTTRTGMAVLQLKELTLATRPEFEKDRHEIMRTLQEDKGRDAVARYVAALRSAAKDKIKTDERLLEESSSDAEGDS